MKAIVYQKYGSPEVLELGSANRPVPKEDEVLVRIHASSANPADWHLIRGKPLFSRLSSGLFKPKTSIPGLDISGIVESTGNKVSTLKPGDEVFGDCGWGGGFAEYVCTSEDHLVTKPSNISFIEAASVPVAGITALQGLNYNGTVHPGNKVLVNGASGGVGTFAVQIARSYGAEVTGVCSAPKKEMVLSAGASRVIDYTREDFTSQNEKYDIILDAVGNRSVAEYERALTKGGRCVIVGFFSMGRLLQHALLPALSSRAKEKKVLLMGTVRITKKDLEYIQELLKTDAIKPVIDRVYPLHEANKAIAYLEEKHARGKVMLSIDPEIQ